MNTFYGKTGDATSPQYNIYLASNVTERGRNAITAAYEYITNVKSWNDLPNYFKKLSKLFANEPIAFVVFSLVVPTDEFADVNAATIFPYLFPKLKC